MTDPVNQICFPQDTAHRKEWFTGVSFSHPAKMHLSLQIYLIETYTKVGDVICDPMLGSGSLLVACVLGRHVIGIELEQKFVDMAKANWEKIKSQGPMLGCPMGTATILQGDSRNLPEVLADVICTSPPFGEQSAKGFTDNQIHKAEIKHKRTFTKRSFSGAVNYSDNPSNIGNLKYGSISAIVSSPPYEGSVSGKELPDSEKLIERKSGKEKWGKHLRLGKSQLTKYADSIICSPPYEEGGGHGGKPSQAAVEKRQSSMGQGTENLYAANSTNIGNLKGESYLSAMLQVYQGCHRVLRDGGLMCLVTKNFIRQKKIVDLAADTIKLCEQSGFVLKERLARKLTQQSFWRVIALLKCDNRKGKKWFVGDIRCKLGLKCPVKIDDQMFNELFFTKEQDKILTKDLQIIEKLCPKFVNTMPKIEFEDVLVFEKGVVTVGSGDNNQKE